MQYKTLLSIAFALLLIGMQPIFAITHILDPLHLFNTDPDPAVGGLPNGTIWYNPGIKKIKYWDGTNIQILTATSGGSGTAYDRIQDEGVNLTQRTTLSLNGTSVTCSDTGGKTQCVFTDTNTDILVNVFEGGTMIGAAARQLDFTNIADFDVTLDAGNNQVDIGIADNAITSTEINDNTVGNADIATHTSTKITITAKGQLNSAIVYNDQANTFADFDQTLTKLLFNSAAACPAGTVYYICRDSGTSDLFLNVPTGELQAIRVNNVNEYTFSSTALDASSNDITNINVADFNVRTSDPSVASGNLWFRDVGTGFFKFGDNQGTPAAKFFLAEVQDEGIVVTTEPRINFIGTGVSCVDNGASARTDCTITSGGGSGTLKDIQLDGVDVAVGRENVNVNDTSSGGISVLDFSVADEATPNRGTITAIPRGLIQAGDSADIGTIRLLNAAQECWEASPAGTDTCIQADANEDLLFDTSWNALNINSNDVNNANTVDFDSLTADPTVGAGDLWFRSNVGTGFFKFGDASPTAKFFLAEVQDEGTALATEPRINFIGTGISCVDNGASARTDCTLSAAGSGTLKDIQLEGVDVAVGRENINVNDTSSGGITVLDFSVADEATSNRGTITAIPRGLISPGDAAETGQIRLINGDLICWEASPAAATEPCISADANEDILLDTNVNALNLNSNQMINSGYIDLAAATCPAASTYYICRDTSNSDLALNVPTGEIYDLRFNGVAISEYTFSSTTLAVGGNTISTIGALIQSGDAADAAFERLINTAQICWEADPAGTDQCIGNNTTEDFVWDANWNNIDHGSNPLINTVLRSGSTGNTVIAEPSFAVCTALGATIPLAGGGSKTQLDLTNSDPWAVSFTDGSTQTMHCDFRIRSDIDTAETWDVIIYWHSSTASTNNVRWSVSTCTPAVGASIDCTYGTASASNCAGQGTARFIASCALTITSANHSTAIDDVVKMQIQRIGADAGDNFAGTADLAMVLIEWN